MSFSFRHPASAALLAGLILAGEAVAGDATLLSTFEGPVATRLCAPIASCAGLAEAYAPLLDYPILLEQPALLRDLLLLLDHPELLEGGDMDGAGSMSLATLSDPVAVGELLAQHPGLLDDLRLLPGPSLVSQDDPVLVQLASLLEGVFDPAAPNAGMTVSAGGAGSTVVMRGWLSGEGDAAEGGGARAIVLIDVTALNNQLAASGVTQRSVIRDSFLNTFGVLSANQSSGHQNSQANVRAIALGQGGGAPASAAIGVRTRRDASHLDVGGGARSNRLDGSFIGSAGLVGVNQSAGNANQQVNAVALAIGLDLASVAPVLADADLEAIGATGSGQRRERGPRAEVIDGSFQGFNGVAQVSQSAGDGNVITNSLSASFKVVP